MSQDEKKCIYIFLRKDLDEIQRVVQTGHVCLEVGRKFLLPDARYRLVIFGIRNEGKLRSIIEELHGLKIPYLTFEEPDLQGSLTAIATQPLTALEGQVFSRYRLLQSESER